MPANASRRLRSPLQFRLWAGLAIVALAILTAWLLRWRAPEGSLPEVAQSDLDLREGRWFFKGQTNALTGWLVEHYASGVLRARSRVSNGWIEGLSEGYYTNGQRQVEEHFRAGVSQGRRVKWNPDGGKLSEAQIVNGKLHGTFHRWHPDGTLAEEMELKDGEPDGLSRAYYPSGFLKAEARLQRGKVLEQKFWPDGEQRELTLSASGSAARAGGTN